MLEVHDANFEAEVLKTEEPVIVDFWADWCGPCRAVEPVFEELATEYSDGITTARLDVDENPQTPSNYGVQSLPTFLLFENGEVVDRVVGAAPRERLEALFAR